MLLWTARTKCFSIASVCLPFLSDFSLCTDYSICCHNAILKVTLLAEGQKDKRSFYGNYFSCHLKKNFRPRYLKIASPIPIPLSISFFYFLPIVLCHRVANILLKTVCYVVLFIWPVGKKKFSSEKTACFSVRKHFPSWGKKMWYRNNQVFSRTYWIFFYNKECIILEMESFICQPPG